MEIFTKEFSECSEQQIHQELQENGFFCFEKALTEEFVSAIYKSVEENRFGVNNNWIRGVYTEGQYYLTHMLAVSKEFYSYVTHPKVMQISKKILGDRIRLKALRYYETYGSHRMQWHTDNKTDRGFAHIPGVIFIAYLVDVDDGEFQYVSGSHEWSGIRAYSDYSDQEIEGKFSEQIVSFRKPSGSVIIYNTYGVHRAKPAQNKNYIRKSLFFQVDSEVENAEPMMLNPSFCENFSDEIKDYLGFGLDSKYQIFPNSKFKDHPITIAICKDFIGWFSYRIAKRILRLMPRFVQAKIKKN